MIGRAWMMFREERHYRVVLMAFLANVVCYADRVNISVAAISMKEDMHWSKNQQGLVLGSFFWGYLLTQIPGGRLTCVYGGRNVLAVGLAGWTIATLLTPLCASLSFGALLLCRIFMGLFEAVTMPSIHALLGEWVPESERSRAVAFATAGQFLGAFVALCSSPIASYDWRLVFYVYGIISIIFLCIFIYTVPRSKVEKVAYVSVKDNISGEDTTGVELSTMGRAAGPHDNLERENASASLSIKLEIYQLLAEVVRLMKVPCFAAIVTTHISHNYGWYILLMWMPDMLHSKYNVDVSSVGFIALLPYFFAFSIDICWGAFSDYIVASKTLSLLQTRRLSQFVAFVAPSLALLALPAATNLRVAVALLCVGLGLNTASHSGYWSNLVDLSPERAGMLCGISNTFATLPGIYGNALTGAILEYTGGRWTLVYVVAIAHWGVGLAVYMRWSRVSGLDVFQRRGPSEA